MIYLLFLSYCCFSLLFACGPAGQCFSSQIHQFQDPNPNPNPSVDLQSQHLRCESEAQTGTSVFLLAGIPGIDLTNGDA